MNVSSAATRRRDARPGGPSSSTSGPDKIDDGVPSQPHNPPVVSHSSPEGEQEEEMLQPQLHPAPEGNKLTVDAHNLVRNK